MQAAENFTHSPTWQVIHATAVGSAHLNNGLPCQDAAGWRLLPSGILAIALADGAGSAIQAEIAASLAVAEALESLGNSPANQTPEDMDAWSTAIQQAFFTAREAILKQAADAGLEPHDYATTLTCLVADSDGVIFGQVGDGALVARTPHGDLYTLARPQRGAYANETLFLTMPEAIERAEFQAVELDLAGLAVMSDGLLRLALQLPGYQPHTPFFTPLWAFAARAGSDELAGLQLAQFLASERVCARTDDDKSLVIAVLPGYDPHLPAVDADPLITGTEG